MTALNTQPTSIVKVENPMMLKVKERLVVLKPAKGNVHRLVDQAKDLAVAVSSGEGETGQCELLEQTTRNLQAFSNELRVAVAKWHRLTTSDVIGQSDKLRGMICRNG